MEQIKYIIKTEKGYLKGSKNPVGGSEPAFTQNKENALIIDIWNLKSTADNYCLRDYCTEKVAIRTTFLE